MEECDIKPTYYTILPAEVRYDKYLKFPHKIIYSEILTLSASSGYCRCKNKYFANLYNVDIRTIIRIIKDLERAGYIKIIVSKNKRKIKPLLYLDKSRKSLTNKINKSKIPNFDIKRRKK